MRGHCNSSGRYVSPMCMPPPMLQLVPIQGHATPGKGVDQCSHGMACAQALGTLTVSVSPASGSAAMASFSLSFSFSFTWCLHAHG